MAGPLHAARDCTYYSRPNQLSTFGGLRQSVRLPTNELGSTVYMPLSGASFIMSLKVRDE